MATQTSKPPKMKKVFLCTTAIILIASVFTSCKKDKAQTATQKVQHNWTLINVVDNSHDANGDNIQTTTAASGDFMDFNSNGTVSFQIDGQQGTVSYSMVSDTQLLFATETFTINTLTDTQLVLYIKDVISATEYDEETIYLTR